MIINVSRAQALMKCPHEALDRYHRNLTGQTTTSLLDGATVHSIIADGLASRDWDSALQRGEKNFLEAVKSSTLGPEEDYLITSHWELVKAIINIFHEEYEKEDYQVLMPECEFDLDLPGSNHNCLWLHWKDSKGGEYFTPPGSFDILSNNVHSPHEGDAYAYKCPCYVPHRIVGRADAVMRWNGIPAIHEYKTTSIWGEQFWGGFDLDIQISTYMYGVARATGLTPRMCVVAGLFRPSESQVAAWNSKRKYGPNKEEKDYLKYERRPFIRTTEDMKRVEQQLIQLANEWEWRMLTNGFRMSPTKQTCMAYNRKCDFHACCSSHDAREELDLMYPRLGEGWREQKHNYVDVKLEELIEKVQEKTANW